jgi:hypothetical protein
MRFAGLLLSMVLLGACEGDVLPTVGFVNHTQHSTAHLWTLWRAAQMHLSHQVDLNPLQRVFSDAQAEILPGDWRAWNISPRQVLVGPQPDVSATDLYSSTGMIRAEPSGLIRCPQPCNVQFAPAYSRYAPPLSYYAQSWEFSGDNFDLLVQYEFENHILNALEYDTRWR